MIGDLAGLLTRILVEVPFGSDVIDVGAGLEAPYQRGLQARCRRLVLVDAHQPYLDANVTKGANVTKVRGIVPGCLSLFGGDGTLSAYAGIVTDRPLTVPPEFDVAVCIDFIEHLEKLDAHYAILQMQRIARKVVLFTPMGVSPQDHDTYMMGADHWQTHNSEWHRETLEKYGFNVGVMDDFHGLGHHALFGIWRAK